MIRLRERFAIQFDNDRLSVQPKHGQQSGHCSLAFELMRLSVKQYLHGQRKRAYQDGQRISLSQSFQTGSKPLSRRRSAMVETDLWSSISNWGVALVMLQPAGCQ